MRRIWGRLYAIFLLLALAASEGVIVFYFAGKASNPIAATIYALGGFLLALILAPALHECGHIVFAKAGKMRLKMTKFSFFSLREENGKLRFSFASPFREDETQAVPLCGGNMKKRVRAYTLGGLIFGGAYMLLLLAAALLSELISDTTVWFFWSGFAYAAYLFLLNVVPVRYAGGKTDMAIFCGLQKGGGAEESMVNAMEIYGALSEGKSFSQIDRKFYFEVPQLAEDEPMYAIMLDLRYRFYLETEETEKAADCLNRLALASPYLPQEVFRQTAAELAYMHSLNGDGERAEESKKLAEEYLCGETAAAKRILAAYAALHGETEEVKRRKTQAETCLEKEIMPGVKKFEKILLERISA